MPRTVRCSLIQATNVIPPGSAPNETPLAEIKERMIEKHLGYIRQAAEAGAQIVCLQEIFYGPYFCAEQTTRWYDSTEAVPDGPTIRLMQDSRANTTSRSSSPSTSASRKASTTTPPP